MNLGAWYVLVGCVVCVLVALHTKETWQKMTLAAASLRTLVIIYAWPFAVYVILTRKNWQRDP